MFVFTRQMGPQHERLKTSIKARITLSWLNFQSTACKTRWCTKKNHILLYLRCVTSVTLYTHCKLLHGGLRMYLLTVATKDHSDWLQLGCYFGRFGHHFYQLNLLFTKAIAEIWEHGQTVLRTTETSVGAILPLIWSEMLGWKIDLQIVIDWLYLKFI